MDLQKKSRLTAEYLSTSFNFYRRASTSCTNVFRQCIEKQYEKILLCGVSELAEIASLRAKELNITSVGFLDNNSEKNEFIGLPVWSSLDEADDFDACVITALKGNTELINYVSQKVSSEKIFIPEILGFNTNDE